jgi:hypothetical protein
MGLLSRIVDHLVRLRATHRGARLEAVGKLDEAYEVYRTGGDAAQATRVLLAQASAQLDPTRRLAMLQLAATRAPQPSPESDEARRRAACLRLDIVRNSPSAALPSERTALAFDLEALQLHREAAEAYGLADDLENQTRMLAACGAIDELERTLAEAQRVQSAKQTRKQVCQCIRDLDSIGQRLCALEQCEAWLAQHPLDEEVRSREQAIRDRIVRPGPVPVRVHGVEVLLVVDCPVIVGRSDASIVIPSPALSRQHLEIGRDASGLTVRDLGSRNGTWLAGSRIDGTLPVGNGLELRLGGQIPCSVHPGAHGDARIQLPGQLLVASLGPLRIEPFEVRRGAHGHLQLHAGRTGLAPVLNGLTADASIDLSFGDQVRAVRDGPILFEVLAP